jgi:hypothetical protein
MPYKGDFVYVEINKGLTVSGVEISGFMSKSNETVTSNVNVTNELTILSDDVSVVEDKIFNLPDPVVGFQFTLLNLNTNHNVIITPKELGHRINKTLETITLTPHDTVTIVAVTDSDWWLC